MYHPKSRSEMFDILEDLQHYAEIHGFPVLSETLADAAVILALEEKQLSRAKVSANEIAPISEA